MTKDSRMEQDKANIVEWLQRYCPGYKKALTRENIVPYVLNDRTFPTKEAKDRRFREVASELIHDGDVASSNTRGYWRVPIYTRDSGEIKAVLQCHQERKSKALSLIADCDKIIRNFEDRLLTITQGQKEF